MAVPKTDKASITSAPSDTGSNGLSPVSGGVGANVDADAAKLAQMGYTQDMQRNFSVISLLGVAFSLANSWFGISVSTVFLGLPLRTEGLLIR